jgi:hypothetical protein
MIDTVHFNDSSDPEGGGGGGDGEKDDSADEGEDIDMSNRWLFASLCLVTLVDLVHE